MRQLTFDVNARNGERAIAWTRDGKSLVYSRNTGPSVGNLWKLDLDSGRSQQLTFGDDATPHYAETTPDGQSVIFGYDKGGTSQLWQVGLNGEDLRQISEGAVAAAPEISPDGKWLYYLSDGLWKRPLDSGPAVKVLEKGAGTVRVSPTEPGLFAAYYYDRDERAANPWKFVLFNESDPGSFTDLKIAALIYFEWKPDGSGIYFADNGESYSNIWFRSVTDMSVTKITDFGDQRIGNFAISPDGGTFAISRGSAIGRIVRITPQPAT